MKLCVFIHFGKYTFIPRYVEVYLNELIVHFDEIIFVTNEREEPFAIEGLPPKIRVLRVENEGYDLGMFYKAFQTIDLQNVNQIACINDSNILLNQLTRVMAWGQKSKMDFWGIIDSHERPWFSTHPDNFHIQSHFLVFGERAIEKLTFFFLSLDMDALFSEKDQKKLRRNIINDWEIGLTQFMLREDLEIGSYIESKCFCEKHRIKGSVNLGHRYYATLIEEGYPLLKKKVVFNKTGLGGLFNRHSNWEAVILKHGNRNWNMQGLIDELIHLKGS